MKVGYTAINSPEETHKLLKAGVKEIIVPDTTMSESDSFRECITQNKDKTIVLVSLASIGPKLTTRGLLDTLVMLRDKERDFHVIEQGIGVKIPDLQYRELLISFVETDQAAIICRTKEGLEKARLNGKIGGRPKINKEIAERIRFLYHTKKVPLRQIAADCNVSLGTAYKYANQE